MLTETLEIVLTLKIWGTPKSGALGLSLFSLMVNPRLARGFLNYRLKYCWPKVFNCTCLRLSDGRYFNGLASILLLI